MPILMTYSHDFRNFDHATTRSTNILPLEAKKTFFAPLLALVDTSFQSERLSHEKGDTDEGKKCHSS